MTTGQRWTRLAAAAHVLTLVGGFLVLLNCNKDQWFFGDEWDFLGHRGVFGAERSLWAPHTEHWSTGPILIYRALYSRYGLLSYMPYVVVLLVLHLAVAHFLWRLLRQAGVDPVLSTAVAGVYVLLGSGYENLLWAFQIGFIGSVAFGVAALVLVNHGGRWGARDVSAWFLSVAGLVFSGIGVTVAAIAGITVLMRRGVRQAMLTVSVPGITYLVWYFLAGDTAVESTKRTWDDVYKYPEYIWTGLRSAFEATLGFPGAGAIVVLALAAYLLRRAGHASGPAAPAFASAVGAVILLAVIATGRAGLGVEQAEASRYTYIVMALALPGIGLALAELAGQGPLVAPRRRAAGLSGALGGNPAPSGPDVLLVGAWGGPAGGGRRLLLCVVLAMVAIHNGGILADQSKVQKRLEQRLKARILAADELVASPAVILGGNPEPEYSPDIVVADLRRMHRDHKLPAPTRITPDDRITVAGILQYAAGAESLAVPFNAAPVDGVVGASVERDAAGCLRLVPTAPVVELHLAGGDPISVRVTSSVAGDLTGYLRLFTPKVLTGAPHVDKIRAGVPLYVNVTAAVDQVVLRMPPSATTVVCGVG